MPRIMISYRREDSQAITGRIFDRLAAHFGRQAVFRDLDSIPPGVDYRDHIEQAIAGTDLLLVIVGPHWTDVAEAGERKLDMPDDPVRNEIEAALRLRKTVIPVLIDRATMPNPRALPESLQKLSYLQAYDIDSGRFFENHIAGLIEFIRQGGASQPRVPKTPLKIAFPGRPAIIGVAFAAVLVATGGLLWWLLRPHSGVEEFAIPTAQSGTHNLAIGNDDALWFAEEDKNQIGRVTTTGEMHEYPVPTPNGHPFDIVLGDDFAVWFTENEGDRIGRITTDGKIQDFPVPAPGSHPQGITVGPDDAIWFTEHISGKIARIDEQGHVEEYKLRNPASGPTYVTLGSDKALWFIESKANKIGRMTTAGKFEEYAIPTRNAALGHLVTGPDGAIWFAENAANKIGRITTGGVITEYSIPTPKSAPVGITIGPDNQIWFTESDGNRIGRIDSHGHISEGPVLPVFDSQPLGIIGNFDDGKLWFVEWQANKIAAASLK